MKSVDDDMDLLSHSTKKYLKKTLRFTHNGRNLATKTNSYLFYYVIQISRKRLINITRKANKISISFVKDIYFVVIKHNVDIQNIGN